MLFIVFGCALYPVCTHFCRCVQLSWPLGLRFLCSMTPLTPRATCAFFCLPILFHRTSLLSGLPRFRIPGRLLSQILGQSCRLIAMSLLAATATVNGNSCCGTKFLLPLIYLDFPRMLQLEPVLGLVPPSWPNFQVLKFHLGCHTTK